MLPDAAAELCTQAEDQSEEQSFVALAVAADSQLEAQQDAAPVSEAVLSKQPRLAARTEAQAPVVQQRLVEAQAPGAA